MAETLKPDAQPLPGSSSVETWRGPASAALRAWAMSTQLGAWILLACRVGGADPPGRVTMINLTYTADQYFHRIEMFNEFSWPIQIIIYLLAFAAMWYVVRPRRYSDRFVSGVLGAFWLLTGVIFYPFMTGLTDGWWILGILFGFEGLLLVFYGTLREHLRFYYEPSASGVTGMAFVIFAALVYPVLAHFMGHPFPASASFGLTPATTMIFTLGLLLMTKPGLPKMLLGIPVVGAVVCTLTAVTLPVFEDLAVAVAIAVAVPMLLLRGVRRSHPKTHHPLTA